VSGRVDVHHVARAGERPAFQPPDPDPTDDTYASLQRYLQPAEVGIDAEFMWTREGGGGAGIRFVDIEQGWPSAHEDLPVPLATLGYNDPAFEAHGAGVLGVICASDDARGVIGIAPESTLAACISIQVEGGGQTSVANAVTSAIQFLTPGDVILVEEELVRSNARYPVEVSDPEFHAIRLATALGYIVIEPAGNSEGSLDTNSETAAILGRKAGTWRDSGAIMVGAGYSENRNRVTGCRYGSRIDCWAQGANVVSCGNGDLAGTTPADSYTQVFGGTSAAAAIIAGAAIVVQSYNLVTTGARLTPRQMRSVLPMGGTLPADGSTDVIGRMPDLEYVVQFVLGRASDGGLRSLAPDDLEADGTVG
jgi:hypothetical protein